MSKPINCYVCGYTPRFDEELAAYVCDECEMERKDLRARVKTLETLLREWLGPTAPSVDIFRRTRAALNSATPPAEPDGVSEQIRVLNELDVGGPHYRTPAEPEPCPTCPECMGTGKFSYARTGEIPIVDACPTCKGTGKRPWKDRAAYNELGMTDDELLRKEAEGE